MADKEKQRPLMYIIDPLINERDLPQSLPAHPRKKKLEKKQFAQKLAEEMKKLQSGMVILLGAPDPEPGPLQSDASAEPGPAEASGLGAGVHKQPEQRLPNRETSGDLETDPFNPLAEIHGLDCYFQLTEAESLPDHEEFLLNYDPEAAAGVSWLSEPASPTETAVSSAAGQDAEPVAEGAPLQSLPEKLSAETINPVHQTNLRPATDTEIRESAADDDEPESLGDYPNNMYRGPVKIHFRTKRKTPSKPFKHLSIPEKAAFLLSLPKPFNGIITEIKTSKRSCVGIVCSFSEINESLTILNTNDLHFYTMAIQEIQSFKIISL
ncbi:CotO family spore coat protein [Metabacillus sp. 84]|uniref:CotO family spore coat protein n=1 Tax=unclassified Metabacillus TaxID=2675274 RepID=UPI003CE96EBA